MHWIVEVLQHITSPLTSALTIFGTYKASHIPKIRIFFRAKRVLFWHQRRGALAIAPTPVSALEHNKNVQSHATMPDSTGQHRSFSTFARVPFKKTLGLIGSARNFSSSRTTFSEPSVINQLSSDLAQPIVDTMTTSQPIVDNTTALAAQPIAEAIANSHGILHNCFVISPVTGSEVFWSVNQFEILLAHCHTDFGMPWWAAILSTTLAFRFVVLPLNVSLVRNTARLYLIKPDFTRLSKPLYEGTPNEQVQAAEELMQICRKINASPYKNIVSPILFPAVFLSLFGAVSDMCTNHPDLKTSGVLWFQDLSAMDTTGVLPVISALTWLSTIELASGSIFHMPAWMHLGSRVITCAFIPITQTLPAGVFIFWITSNVFAASRAALLRIPAISRFCGIPAIKRHAS